MTPTINFFLTAGGSLWRLSLVSNTKLKTEMKEGPDSHCHIKCKLHVALGLTHALGLAGCPTFELMHANRRNIRRFQGRHVVSHRPCIFSACTAVSWT